MAGTGINWGTVNNVLGSKGVEVGLGILGSGLAAAGDARQQDQNRQLTAAQARAQLLQRQLENQQTTRLQQSTGAAAASPLGQNEAFAARQALLRELLPQMRNFSVTPGDPAVAAAMGRVNGGARLPEGGLSPAALQAFGPQATAAALAQRQKLVTNIDPTAPQIDLAALGLDQAGVDPSELARYAAGVQQTRGEEDDSRQRMILAALEQDYQQEKQKKDSGGGFWKTLGKIATVAAPIVAAPFTGGASLALIGAASGAANAALSGGGVKGALLGAGMGAVPGLVKGPVGAVKPGTPPFVAPTSPRPWANVRF
jgi:hypothetical protein